MELIQIREDKTVIPNNNMSLRPAGEYPHITRQEFCMNMDNYLDDVEKNRTAYVLTEEGKKDLILCPADWFSFAFNEDFGLIVNAAVRYSIGRHTYMPYVVSDFISKYLHALSDNTLFNIEKDIERELRDGPVDQAALWRELSYTVAAEQQARKDD